MERTSTKHAPWYVIPSDHKWFRKLGHLRDSRRHTGRYGLKLPPTQVDIAEIRGKAHSHRTPRMSPSRRNFWCIAKQALKESGSWPGLTNLR